MDFNNVTAHAVGNVYFDGKVVSHKITMEDGSAKTMGVIQPGSYHFDTVAAERMDITAGECKVTLDGSKESSVYKAGEYFNVDANSGFTIEVAEGNGQYVCSYL
ncbi:pyrimidine/purine nucleoside phosphorylase [Rubritalea halochordaticola]|uniref:Pyrimidine/purine nucleoside phosphorylase n=1 Tax=Rubritalea halochordaticola TaxID=714537 RepID=A0ABP9UWJ0_9BACT